MNDNPKWKPFLDAVPDSLHPIIKPVLQEWDKGVQEMVNGIHKQYEPYKAFVDNKVDPNRINQALQIADQISSDPAEFAQRLDQAFNLNLFQQDSNSNDLGTGSNDEDWDGVDIAAHPQFKQMASMLEQVNNTLQQQADERKSQAEQQSFEEYLDSLEEDKKDKGVWNKTLVTAYMTQGLSGEQAWDQVQKDFADVLAGQTGQAEQNNQQQGQVGTGTDNPPPVMGSTGTAGSGLPDTSVKPSTWSSRDTNAAVAAMLKAAAEASGD